MASGTWKNITNDPVSGGDQAKKDEPRQRDSEKWRLPLDDRVTHARVAGAPEDLRLLPGDLDLKPQEVGADLDEWTDNSLENLTTPVFYWDTNSLQTSVLDP